jgi:hypothetical protein
MLLNKNCPSLANCDDVGSEICFLRLAFEGLYLWNKESLGLFFWLVDLKESLSFLSGVGLK